MGLLLSDHVRGIAVALLAVGWIAAHAPTASAAPSCPPAPAAVINLDLPRYYSDAAGTRIDAAKKAIHAQQAAELKRYVGTVAKFADRGPQACAVAWLQAWAKENALLGTMSTKQAEYQRKWDLTGLALAYVKVRGEADAQSKHDIDAWLKNLAIEARRFFDAPGIKRNNHWYWLGLGLGATAAATDDAQMWRDARAIYDDALADIGNDGTLAMELARGNRALKYHAFSVMPLVVLAELAARRGEDWYAARDARLHTLVAATVAGLTNPEAFARRVGVAQQAPVPPGAGWWPLYTARFADRAKGFDIAMEPGHRWLGGNPAGLPMMAHVTRRTDPAGEE